MRHGIIYNSYQVQPQSPTESKIYNLIIFINTMNNSEPPSLQQQAYAKFLASHSWCSSHWNISPSTVYHKSASSFIAQLNHKNFLTKPGFFSSSHDIAVTFYFCLHIKMQLGRNLINDNWIVYYSQFLHCWCVDCRSLCSFARSAGT